MLPWRADFSLPGGTDPMKISTVFKLASLALLLGLTAPLAGATTFNMLNSTPFSTQENTWHEKTYQYSGLYNDRGDAPGYAMAENYTDEWQRLGSTYGTDDGISWSVDGGNTWGFDSLQLGQTFLLRFDIQRPTNGNHKYDQLKAWIDWDGDKTWADPSEQVAGFKWLKIPTLEMDLTLHTNILVTEIRVPEYSLLGDTWLRARVTCWDVKYEDTTPYGHWYQGETEDYRLRIEGAPVPEPATVVLMGLGVSGLLLLRRSRSGRRN